ncbi:MAG: hypothetical protein ACLQVG_14725 [Terriglobia bacterium]
MRSFRVRQLAAAFPPASLLAGLPRRTLPQHVAAIKVGAMAATRQLGYGTRIVCTFEIRASKLAGRIAAASCRTLKLRKPARPAPRTRL